MDYSTVADDFDIMDIALRELIHKALVQYAQEYNENPQKNITVQATNDNYRVKVCKCKLLSSPTLNAIVLLFNSDDAIIRILEHHIKEM